MFSIAGVPSGNDIATLTDDQKALHTAKQQGLLNMDKLGVVEVVDRPQSQQVLSARRVSDTTAGRMWHGGLSKLSVLMQIFVLQERQSSRLCEDFSPLLQFTEIQLLSEIVTVRFTHHRCHVSEPVVCGASTRSAVGLFQGVALQESASGTQDFSSGPGYSQHTEHQRHELRPVEISHVREQTYATIGSLDPG